MKYDTMMVSESRYFTIKAVSEAYRAHRLKVPELGPR